MRLLSVAASLALLGSSVRRTAAAEVFAIQIDPSQAYAIGGVKETLGTPADDGARSAGDNEPSVAPAQKPCPLSSMSCLSWAWSR